MRVNAWAIWAGVDGAVSSVNPAANIHVRDPAQNARPGIGHSPIKVMELVLAQISQPVQTKGSPIPHASYQAYQKVTAFQQMNCRWSGNHVPLMGQKWSAMTMTGWTLTHRFSDVDGTGASVKRKKLVKMQVIAMITTTSGSSVMNQDGLTVTPAGLPT